MTIYNEVTCYFPAPDHDPGCIMITSLFEDLFDDYTITKEGHLIRNNKDIIPNENAQGEKPESEIKSSFSAFRQRYRIVDAEKERVMFHGFLPMHSQNAGPYTAKFIDGVVTEIRKGTISDYARSEMSTANLSLYLDTCLTLLDKAFPDTETLRDIINLTKNSIEKTGKPEGSATS